MQGKSKEGEWDHPVRILLNNLALHEIPSRLAVSHRSHPVAPNNDESSRLTLIVDPEISSNLFLVYTLNASTYVTWRTEAGSNWAYPVKLFNESSVYGPTGIMCGESRKGRIVIHTPYGEYASSESQIGKKIEFGISKAPIGKNAAFLCQLGNYTSLVAFGDFQSNCFAITQEVNDSEEESNLRII